MANEDRLLSEDFDRAIAILQKAREKRSVIFLKGCIGYITKMCPEELKWNV